MNYWYLSLIVHAAEQPFWMTSHKWPAYIKEIDERVQTGDVVLIGNQGSGIFAWGTILRIGEGTEGGEFLIEISRGDLRYSLIGAEVLAEIPELSLIVRSPNRPFTFLTKQQVRTATSRLGAPQPPEPVGYDFILGSQLSADEDLRVEYKNVAPGQVPKEAYEYAVAFARGAGGSIYFGVSDDGIVRGMRLDFSQRNDLRKRIEEKLFIIDPPLRAVEDYTIYFANVIDADGHPVLDTYVIDLEVKPTGEEHRTAGGRAFHKGFSGKRKV